MGHVRVIVPSVGNPSRSVAALLRRLQDEGRRIVYVTAERPYHALMASLRDLGVAVDAVHFIDTVSALGGSTPTPRPANASFLSSPTMLEMLAMRVEQAALRIGAPAHVVLDSLDALSLYNGVHPVQEFSHYLANRLRAQGVHGDFIVREGATGRSLHDLVSSFTDDRLDLPLEGVA